jgi:hypothetical protein
MRKTVEELARDFVKLKGVSDFKLVTSYENMFKWGYNQKSAEIKDLIEKLELTKLEHSQSSGINIEAVNNYNTEQDRKINLLKILL